jgi:hypothetical protein
LEAEAGSRAPEERGAEAARASAPATGDWARPSAEEPPPAEEWAPPTKEFAAFVQSPGVAEARPAPAAQAPASDVIGEAEPPAPVGVETESPEEAAPAPEEAGRAGDLRGRVARVREGTRARVGRMREEAIVVLEETPDDSGLRFVLAAAALFVVFLVLLFLSTTVLR